MLLASGEFKATGGTITQEGDYTVHTFTSNGTFQVTSGVKEVDYLIIGGGGTGYGVVSGSGGISGGGGAGDYVEKLARLMSAGSFSVVVAATKVGPSNGALPGDSSSFNGDTAIGGGAGSSGSGASGGGAYGTTPGVFVSGGASTGILGNAGGNHAGNGYGAAGGGGAGGVGGNNSGATGGIGGSGLADLFWLAGQPVCVGGGGASESGSGGSGRGYGGNGASGGGGAGGNATGYGCGGGGSRNNGGFGGNGGNGGPGLVIIKYKTI